MEGNLPARAAVAEAVSAWSDANAHHLKGQRTVGGKRLDAAGGRQLDAARQRLDAAGGQQLPARGQQLPAGVQQLTVGGQRLIAAGEQQIRAGGHQLDSLGQQLGREGSGGQKLDADGGHQEEKSHRDRSRRDLLIAHTLFFVDTCMEGLSFTVQAPRHPELEGCYAADTVLGKVPPVTGQYVYSSPRPAFVGGGENVVATTSFFDPSFAEDVSLACFCFVPSCLL